MVFRAGSGGILAWQALDRVDFIALAVGEDGLPAGRHAAPYIGMRSLRPPGRESTGDYENKVRAERHGGSLAPPASNGKCGTAQIGGRWSERHATVSQR